MADEGASSSSNSFDEHVEDRRESQPTTYTSSFTSHAPNDNCTAVSSSGHMTSANPVSGIIGHSRLSYNPFAIKTATPTRSLADSTDNKESRPLVAPPTLKLGNSDSPGGITSSAPKIVLRPSALTAQAEKLKLMNKQDSGSNKEMKENDIDESNNIASKEVHSTNCESNGKISKSELFASGISTSLADAATLLSSTPSNASGMGDNIFGLAAGNSEDKSPDGSSFVFGQNLHERALVHNYEACAAEPLSPTDSHNLTFEEAALKKEELEKMEREEQEEKLTKSLSESAKEYESRQIKRKFDQVTVITGEEEESNVLQMNCKLFAFNKVNMNWQERGRGILRLNDREYDGVLHSRVVMRTQGSLRVVLNTKVWAGMSVEHPSSKTVRLTAIDTQGIKVFLVMAHPKDSELLFNALDWRVATLKSQEETSNKSYGERKSIIEEATSSSGLPDTSSNDNFGDSPNKRCRISQLPEGGADSSTETDFYPRSANKISSDSFVDSTEAANAACRDLDDHTSLVRD